MGSGFFGTLLKCAIPLLKGVSRRALDAISQRLPNGKNDKMVNFYLKWLVKLMYSYWACNVVIMFKVMLKRCIPLL